MAIIRRATRLCVRVTDEATFLLRAPLQEKDILFMGVAAPTNPWSNSGRERGWTFATEGTKCVFIEGLGDARGDGWGVRTRRPNASVGFAAARKAGSARSET